MADDVDALRSDNERLRAEVARLQADLGRARQIHDDLWSHEIYLRARKKLLAAVVTIAGALALVGAYTLFQIYDGLVDYAERGAVERIDAWLATELDGELDRAGERVRLEIEQRIEPLVAPLLAETRAVIDARIAEAREQVAGLIEEGEREIRLSAGQAQTALQTAGEAPAETAPSPAAEGFYVVAGSSPLITDLDGERQRVTRNAARDPDLPPLAETFPDLRIASPAPGRRNYALVVGGPMPLGEAEALREAAVAYGFRGDTWVIPASRAYFR